VDCQENKNKTLLPDVVLEKFDTITSFNQLVPSFAGWLQSEFNHRNDILKILIARIESLLPSDEFPVRMERDMVNFVNNEEITVK
jgi:hypothetical protein